MSFPIGRNSRKSKRNSVNLMAETDKWRTYSKIFSSQITNFNINEDDDEEELSEQKSVDWEQFYNQKDNTSEISDQDQEIILSKKQTLILATMVPNELLTMNE